MQAGNRILLYQKTRLRLLDFIAAHKLNYGDKLPPERSLVHLLNCSSITLRRALSELEHRGVLESRHGSGTYVRQQFLQEESCEHILALVVRRPDSIAEDDYPFLGLRRFLQTRGIRLNLMSIYGWSNDVYKAAAGALGVIVTGYLSDGIVKNLELLGLPVIIAGVTEKKYALPTVDVTPEDEAYRLTNIFISQGCKRIYAMSLLPGYLSFKGLKSGYEKAMTEAGLKPVIHTYTSDRTRYEDMDRFLSSVPVPDAAFGHLIAMTIHFQTWCQNHPDFPRIPIGVIESSWQMQVTPYASERMLWSYYPPLEVEAAKILLEHIYEGKELHDIHLKSDIFGVGVPPDKPIRVNANIANS